MHNGFFNFIQYSYDIPFFSSGKGRPDFSETLVMDSAGGNMEFTGFLLYFTSCFYLPLFHSLLTSIGSTDQSLVGRAFRDFSFFFFSYFVRLVWSLHVFSFLFFWVGWRLAYKACIFFLFFSFLFFKPIHLGFGDSGDGDYYGSVPFLLRTMAQEMRQAEEDVFECIFLLSTKIMRSVLCTYHGLS